MGERGMGERKQPRNIQREKPRNSVGGAGRCQMPRRTQAPKGKGKG